MSVVFDVLDSLNSIRNVEDLKKRWEVDSKRPQTLSYEAVDMFMCLFSGYVDADEFVIRLSNFTLRYREVVSENICSAGDLAWLMPYIRYAEKLKAFIAYGEVQNFEPDSFALKYREQFSSKHIFTKAYDAVCKLEECLQQIRNKKITFEQGIELFSLFQLLLSIAEDDQCGEHWSWLTQIAVPMDQGEDYYIYNPWHRNPYSDDSGYWMDSIDTLCENDFATIYPFFGSHLLYDMDLYSDFLKKGSSTLSSLKDSDVVRELYDANDDLFNLNSLIESFSVDRNVINYLIFKQIMAVISDTSQSSLERIKIIQNSFAEGLPWNFDIKLRYAIEPLFIEYMENAINKITCPAEVSHVFEQVKLFKSLLPEDIFSYCVQTFFAPQTYEAAIREDERKKVMFEISHSIKNLMASVSEPLDMLKDQLEGTQRRTVENALAGAGLIRDLAVGVHMSMRGEPGTWRKDVLEPGFGAATLDKIILDAVRHAVSNMFDGKYFAQFVKNYFGKDLNTFMQAQNEWKAAVSAEDTFACINKYFFDFKIDCGESSLNIPVGDRDGTATKLLILFQELFLNAVKYSSFTEREKRFVKLDVAITPENWNIKLSNSAVGRKNTKSSGIGLAVIKNFAALFEAKYDANCKNDTYISSINFSLNK